MAGLLLWSGWRETFTFSPVTDFKPALHLNTSVWFWCGISDVALKFLVSEMYTGIISFLFPKRALPHCQFPFTVTQVATYNYLSTILNGQILIFVFLVNISLTEKRNQSKRLHFSIKLTIVAVSPHSGESDS